jgi:hypothetical protein
VTRLGLAIALVVLVTTIRGAPATVFDDRVELYTRHTTVVVFAPTPGAARRMAAGLRTLDGRIGPGEALLPASAAALANRLPCRGQSAGELGFEPRFMVLETMRVAIDSLPQRPGV